ncbi:MAG: hypothetical protein AB7I37_16355 [Pirellulales bacterium]
MHFSSIPGGQQIVGAWSKGADMVQASLGAAAGGTATVQPGQTGPSTLKKIVAQYDLTRVSPREFSELLDRLKQSGALSDADFQDLAGIRLELDKADFSPDETVNLLELLSGRVAALTSEAAGNINQESLSSAQRQLAWVRQFSSQPVGQGEMLDVTV